MKVLTIVWLALLTVAVFLVARAPVHSEQVLQAAWERADGAYSVITAHIAGKPPLLASHRRHAQAIDSNRAYCQFLHAKVESLANAR